MLKIAICDDEKVFRDNINKYVAAYLNEKEISYEIDTFSSGKEIIDLGIEIKQYNIIIHPERIFSLDDTQEAHSYLESRTGFGKVVVIP